MWKKTLACVLSLSLVFTMVGTLPAMAAEPVSNPSVDISASSLTIRDSGGAHQYSTDGNTWADYTGTVTVSGTSASNTVTVQSGAHSVALNGANIDVSSMGSVSAFSIASGASVSLTLSGTNVLKSGSRAAGLQVPEGAAVTIGGSGSLAANSNNGGAGIGSGGWQNSAGIIIINGGTITANGGSNIYGGAGIGGGCADSGGTITINGGTIVANGGAGGDGGAGIGGGYSGNGGTVTITGGSVTAIGNGIMSTGAGIGGDSGSAGTTVITGGSVKASSVQGTVTDTLGNIEHLVTVDASAVAGDTAAVSASAGGGPVSDMKTDASGKLYFWTQAGDSASFATIKYGSDYYGSAAVSDLSDNSAAVTLTADNKMSVLDVASGSISIGEGTVSQVGQTPSVNYNGYVITQSNSSTATGNNVTVTGGVQNIVLDGVNISSGGAAFDIQGTSSVNLVLSGENVLHSGRYAAGLQVPYNASVTITGGGSDSLTATGGNDGAGIGGGSYSNGYGVSCGKVKIGGGAITAKGGYQSPGIGGGGDSIGSGYGGTVLISGGTVVAYCADNGGYSVSGIGGGVFTYSGDAGTTIITGGSVNASSIQGTPTNGAGATVSLATVTLPSGTNIDSLLIKQGGSAYAYGFSGMKTDNNSELYLWLPSSDNTTADIVTDSGIYSGYHNTSSAPNMLKMDQSALSVTGVSSSYTYGSVALSPSASGGSTSGGVTYAFSGTGSTSYGGADAPTGAGTYTVTATRVGDSFYYDVQSVAVPFTIEAKTLTNGMVSSIDPQTYTGSAITPAVTVTDGETTLTENTDYTVSYQDNTSAGTATVTVTGEGNYSGSVDKDFTIQPKTGFTVEDINAQTYTGSALTPTVTVRDSSLTLTGGTDYTVTDNTSGDPASYTDVGSYTVKITGEGNYSGSATKTFTIDPKAMSNSMISDIGAQTYTGNAITPTVTVKDGGKTLVKDTDYSVSYSDNTNAGTATVTVTGKGNYSGTTTKDFAINGKTGFTVDEVSPQTYTGSAITPAVTVKDGDETLVKDTDYTVSYENNTNAGSASIKVTGKGNYSGTVTVVFTINGKTGFTISDISAQTYAGSAITPTVTVKDGEKNLVKDTDYTVSYSDNTNVGTATVTVIGKGNYAGTATAHFTISKAAASVTATPTASGIAVIGKLSGSMLTGGQGSVAGIFSWTNPNTVVSQTGEYGVTFTPTDSTHYSSCTCKVKVTVSPQITNEQTCVTYDLSNTQLPDGVTSVLVKSSIVSSTSSDNSKYSVAKSLINDALSKKSVSGLTVYGLSLIDQNGSTVTGFTGEIMVKLPIPDGMSGDLHVYWYNDADGTVTDMNATQVSGYLVFETTHFSYYAVAELSAKTSSGTGTSSVPNPKTGSSSDWPLIPLALLGGGSAIGAIAMKRREIHIRKKSV